MAAEVSMQIKSEAKIGLITRDFLGGCSNNTSNNSGVDAKELDLDLHVPSGWEKRLDLLSGKVYIQRCDPANAVSDHNLFSNTSYPKLNDLNAFSQTSSSTNSKPTLNLFEQPSLDLKLVSNCSPTSYTSVCTLDKVKSALDRAERSSPSSTSSPRKRWMTPSTVGSPMKTSPSPSNSSSMSIKETDDEEERVSSKGSAVPSDDNRQLVAAACPGCLLYVLISKDYPKCPRCNSVVQLSVIAAKKPKIDLNISI